MIDTLPGYIVNADRFFQLWMVASKMDERKNGDTATMYLRDNWHPAIIEQMDDVRDVPAGINIDNASYNVDTNGRFHTGNGKRTLYIKKMSMHWGNMSLERRVREDGPISVILSNLRMWHHQSVLHRRRGDAILCEDATFTWNDNPRSPGLSREGGPFKVILKNFRAEAKLGVLTNARFSDINVSWSTHNGARPGESRVNSVMEKHGIKSNYMRAGRSVFDDEGEEFIFWSELEA